MSYEQAPRALATSRVLPGTLRMLRVPDKEALGAYEAVSGVGLSGDYRARAARPAVPVYMNRLLIGWTRKPARAMSGFGLDVLGIPVPDVPGLTAPPVTTAIDCPPGTVRDPVSGWCLPDGSGKSPCAPGTRPDPSAGCVFLDAQHCPPDMAPDPLGISCWPSAGPAPIPVPAAGCPTGWMKDPLFGKLCLPTSFNVPPLTPPVGACLPGQYKDWAGNCLVKPAPPLACPPDQARNAAGVCVGGPGPKPQPPPPEPKQAGLFGEPLFWAAVAAAVIGTIIVLSDRDSQRRPLSRAA